MRAPFTVVLVGRHDRARFLTFPLVAIFVDAGPGELLSSLDDPAAVDALASASRRRHRAGPDRGRRHAGAWLLATRRFRGRALAITLVELPLVVPPAVAGIGLLAALGPNGSSAALSDAGIELVFQTAGRGGGARVRRKPLLHPAGAGRLRRARPVAHGGVAHARRERSAHVRARGGPERDARPGGRRGAGVGGALGEFGATLVFAGSLTGVTQTAPLAIYERFADDFTGALALSAVMIALSAAILLGVKLGAGRRGSAMLALEARTRLGRSSWTWRSRSRRGPRAAGPSGAGKTSALRRAPGCCGPSADTCAAGDEVAGHRGRVDSRQSAVAVGYVFQDYALFPNLSAWRNVAYGIGRPRAERESRARELLDRFGMAASPMPGPPRSRAASASGWRWREHSGASRRRSCSTSRCRRWTPAPGPRAARARRGAAAADVPVLLVTHDFEEAALLADRVAIVDAGRVLQSGTATELSASPTSAFVAELPEPWC